MKNLGKKGTDKLSGFTGTISGFAKYLGGSESYMITSGLSSETGKPIEVWILCANVEITG